VFVEEGVGRLEHPARSLGIPRGHHNPAYFAINSLQIAADRCTERNPGATAGMPIQKAGPRQKSRRPLAGRTEKSSDAPTIGHKTAPRLPSTVKG
jgi:hypothetical protein